MAVGNRRALCALIVGVTVGAALTGCAASPSSGSDDRTASPLEPYYAVYGGAQDEEEMAEQNAEVERLIAECMSEAGFDYTPSEGSTSSFDTSDLGMEWGSPEFAEKYGYGISTDVFADLGGGDHGEWVDPNADYVDSLSESEQEAYSSTLWGPPLEADAEMDASSYDWTKGGCAGAAQHEAGAAPSVLDDPEFSGLLDEMNELSTAGETAPSAVAKAAEWSACMADAGFDDLAAKQDAPSAVTERYNGLLSESGGDASYSSNGGGTGVSISGDPSTLDPAALAEVQTFEIEMATTDAECADETGYDDAIDAAQHQKEQEFVDANRAALDAMLAKYGAR